MPSQENPAPTFAPAPAPKRRDMSALYTPLAIIVAGILIGGGLFFGLSRSGTAASAGTAAAPTPAVNVKNVKTAGEPYIGQQNAPVTLAFWSDYECPYCKAWETGGQAQIPGPAVLPSIISEYVDTGKVKIVFKDFEFLGQNSIYDGEWARAIWALYPQQWFAWRTAMYTQQPDESVEEPWTQAQNQTHLEQVTATIPGIDISKVEANVAANKTAYDAAMQADESEGEADGIQGTPGFITGTQEIDGDEPLATFQAALDPQLK